MSFEALLDWEWRDASTLWFLWVPLVWVIVSSVLYRRKSSQYAQSHLMAWVKVSAVKTALKTPKNTRPGRFGVLFIHKLYRQLTSAAFLLSVAWMALIIALAGPRSLVPSPQESTRSGVDILVVLDASRSMLAQDVAPNRFLQAKALIESFVNRLEPNDRVGLMVFAGHAHVVSPLSFDRSLFDHYLRQVRPGMLPTYGSELPEALLDGERHLNQTSGQSRLMLVFTDGQPEPEQLVKVDDRLSQFAKAKTQTIVVGMGKEQMVPIPADNGFLRYNGLLVQTRLETLALKKLATQINATYLPASRDVTFLNHLLEAVAVKAQKRKFSQSQPVWEDHAMPFLWISFFALLWAFYPIRLSRKSAQWVWALGLTGLLWQVSPQNSWAQTTEVGQAQQAFSAFQAKDYESAQEAYDGLGAYQGWFGAGAAAYRLDDFEAAVFYFREAVLTGNNDMDRAQSLFNMGNSFYRANLLSQAIEAYEQALIYWPNYEKAAHNLALAKQRKQRQKGQQQNQEQGDGQGEGSLSRDAEGAFYGGQKPNPNESGEGVSGDAPEGSKDGKDFVLPDEMAKTDFSLETAQSAQMTETANAILEKQQRIRRIEKFEQNMQSVTDEQVILLKNIFEREEGFQASQSEPHALPGVKPW